MCIFILGTCLYQPSNHDVHVQRKHNRRVPVTKMDQL